MGKGVKVTQERCKACRYAMNITGGSMNNPERSSTGAVFVACGYSLKEGSSRIFKDGDYKKDYKPGYCNYYIPGKRMNSIDSITSNSTLKKGKKKDV